MIRFKRTAGPIYFLPILSYIASFIVFFIDGSWNAFILAQVTTGLTIVAWRMEANLYEHLVRKMFDGELTVAMRRIAEENGMNKVILPSEVLAKQMRSE